MTKIQKADRGKWITAAVVILVNLALWIVPSNVAYLLAQNRDILLGRYSFERLTALFILFPVSLVILYLNFANEKNRRQRQFKVTAVVISVLVSLLVVDTAVRLLRHKTYIVTAGYLYRTPNATYTGTYRDVPEKAFAYSTTPPAYPDIEYTLTTDKRGFRNQTDLDRYDIITIGDSFTEGSNIADSQNWPSLIAQKTGHTVYNLGMSSGNPVSYLETIKKFGLQFSPKIVLCMLYEGNDFRDANFRNRNSIREHVSNYFDNSPIRNAFNKSLLSIFGSTATDPNVIVARTTDQNQQADDPATDSPLAWLPVGIPTGPNAAYYTFKVKRLLDHFISREDFERTKGCKKTCDALRKIKNICRQNNARLIVLYAPDKPHTLVPLLKGIVPPEQIRDFMALRKSRLPAPDKIMDVLCERIEVQENTFRDLCRSESIDFFSLTEPLRRAVADGKQVYFTYDQHWTPIGHQIVTETLRACLAADPNQ